MATMAALQDGDEYQVVGIENAKKEETSRWCFPTRYSTLNADSASNSESSSLPQEAGLQSKDAGTLFVLESKGTWLHAGYHLTTAIAGPSLLTLPYAITFLGWGPGLLALTIGGLVSSYAYCLLSEVLEYCASQGNRCYRFRDLSQIVIGNKWTRWFVTPVQFGVCFVTVVGAVLTGGYGVKLIYLGVVPDGTVQLWEFVAAFGAVLILLAQLPSFHSLRYISMVSLMLCLTYSVCAVAGSVVAGHDPDAPPRRYDVLGSPVHKIFGVFTGLSVMTGVFGVAIVPEIQDEKIKTCKLMSLYSITGASSEATLAPPVTGKMFKGIALCYTVVACTFYSVAIAGYWAFGNQAHGNIFDNLLPSTGPKLVPTWLIGVASIGIVAQLLAIGLVYLQPTFDVLEAKTADVTMGKYSLRNVVPRFMCRSVYVAFATLMAAMFPFFGDIIALIGAFGYTPLDFVLPMLFYQIVFRPSRKTFIFWFNWAIIVVFSIIGVIGCVASVRSIVHNASTYHLFANV